MSRLTALEMPLGQSGAMFPAVKVVHSNITAASTVRSPARRSAPGTTFHGHVVEIAGIIEFDHFLTNRRRPLDGPPLRSAGAGTCTGLSTGGVDKVKKRLGSVSCVVFVVWVTASRCN
jgi:hypothetical protein